MLGLPLGSTEQLCPAAMINLLGAPGHRGRPLIRGLAAALAIPGVCVHIYGKAATTPFRKMGHVTVLDRDIEWPAQGRAGARADRDHRGGPSMSASPPEQPRDEPAPGRHHHGQRLGPAGHAGGAGRLEELGVPFEMTIVSAHRTPRRLYDYAGGRWSGGCG
jgi:hypothetical protein